MIRKHSPTSLPPPPRQILFIPPLTQLLLSLSKTTHNWGRMKKCPSVLTWGFLYESTETSCVNKGHLSMLWQLWNQHGMIK